jgi:hypothetical protein
MIGEKRQNDKYLMIDGVMSKSNTLLLHESDRSQKLLLKIEKKSDCPILSIMTAVRGATDTRRESFSSGQATSGQKIGKNYGSPRG